MCTNFILFTNAPSALSVSSASQTFVHMNGSEFLPRCAHSPIKFGFVGTNMCTESGTGLVYFFFTLDLRPLVFMLSRQA